MENTVQGIMQKYRIFQKLLVLIFFLFIGILVFVVIYAHSRKSGQTGLNMTKVQEMRMKATKENSKQP